MRKGNNLYQKDSFIHHMNEGINYLYFGDNIHYTDYGYWIYSPLAKGPKYKHIIYDEKKVPDVEGVIIASSKRDKEFISTKEIMYNLPEVFDRNNYENGKAFKRKVRKNIEIGKKLGIVVRDATIEDLPAIKRINDEWAKRKLDDPRTFKIIFSDTRYYKCAEKALTYSGDRYKFIVLAFEYNNEVVGFRVLSSKDNVLFGAAFIVAYWKASHISEACNLLAFEELIKRNYNYLNTGFTFKTLTKYKSQFPHHTVRLYRKVVKKTPTIDEFFK